MGRFALDYHDRVAGDERLVPFASITFDPDRPGFFSVEDSDGVRRHIPLHRVRSLRSRRISESGWPPGLTGRPWAMLIPGRNEIRAAWVSTSPMEVTYVSPHGFWLFVAGRGLFVPFKDFPWFREATHTIRAASLDRKNGGTELRDVCRSCGHARRDRVWKVERPNLGDSFAKIE
jgi:hypothetical protein